MITKLFKQVCEWEMLNNGIDLDGYDYGWLLYNRTSKEYAYVGWKGDCVASVEITTELK